LFGEYSVSDDDYGVIFIGGEDVSRSGRHVNCVAESYIEGVRCRDFAVGCLNDNGVDSVNIRALTGVPDNCREPASKASQHGKLSIG
jgi:hypothetical protein